MTGTQEGRMEGGTEGERAYLGSYFHLCPDRSEAMQQVVFIPLATDDKINTINTVHLLRVCKCPLLI